MKIIRTFLLPSALFILILSCRHYRENPELTEKEREWLSQNLTDIEFSPDPNFMPFEAIDKEGNYVGIGADILQAVEKKLSVNFKIMQLEDWGSVINSMREGNSSGVLAIVKTPERSIFLDFTEPYIDVPVIVLSRKDFKTFKTLGQLLNNPIGVTTDYSYNEYLQKNFPALNYVAVKNDSEGIKQLAYGDIDLLIINIASASYYIQEHGFTNLKVAGDSGYSFKLSVGIRKDLPELFSIMKKALNQIDKNEKEKIMGKWITLQYPWYKRNPGLFLFLIADISIIIIVITALSLSIILNRALRKKVRDKTEELKNSEEYLKRIVDIIPDPVFVKNSSHIYTMVNNAFSQLLNKKPEDIIGNSEYDIFPADEADRFIETDNQIMKKKGVIEYEDTYISEEGKKHYLLAKKTSLINYTGDYNIVTILHDITDIKEKERALMQSQKLETMGRLSGGFAHDFNNILAGIDGSLDLIEYIAEKNEPIDPKEILNYVSLAKNSSSKAGKIIQNLLSISKKNIRNFNTVDMKKAVDSIIEIASHSFDKRVEIKSITKAIPFYILGDYSLLEQAVLNILINAYHSMTIMKNKREDWGGTITVELKKSYLKTGNSAAFKDNNDIPPGSYCILSITDSGIGMDKKTMDMIFEPFFTTKESSGSGLGMTMVYNIINSFKGYISVKSEVNKGSEFIIYFPEIEYTPEISEDHPKQIFKGSGNILVVDDEEIIRKTVCGMLETFGYKAYQASSGNEALRFLSGHINLIDIIILDFIMPGISAEDTFRTVRMKYPEIPVVLTSGFSKDEGVLSLIAEGIDSFLPKPFSIHELSETIHRILIKKPEAEVQ